MGLRRGLLVRNHMQSLMCLLTKVIIGEAQEARQHGRGHAGVGSLGAGGVRKKEEGRSVFKKSGGHYKISVGFLKNRLNLVKFGKN
jgi:hypothetical protein